MSMWGWIEQASNQAKELATQASFVATEITKQAIEIKETYNLELQKSILATVEQEKKQKTKILFPRENTTLEEIDFIYITENMIGMGFPHDSRKETPSSTSAASTASRGNRIEDISGYLQVHHPGKFMIWNISEESYDYSLFSDQVLEYKFPGHPAPPLGLMFKICTSIESWLDADLKNIAIVHCLTGKGRTAVVLACALTWIGEFTSPMEALSYLAERKKSTIEIITIPSQRRYIQYFSNVLDGVRPHGEPLMLRRVVMNGIPIYGCCNQSDGCCPYLQLFKNGKILANGIIATSSTSEVSSSSSSSTGTGTGAEENASPVRWLNASEGVVSFQINCIVQGDLLIRCRHHDLTTGARISMFRSAFHTGYVSNGVLRLTKAQLDGPNHDDRYSNEFFIDLIFSPVDKQSFTTNAGGGGGAGGVDSNLLSDKFEQMFHRDTRFWETIATRKLKTKKRQSRKFQPETVEKFSIEDDSNKKSNGRGSHFEFDHDDEDSRFLKSSSHSFDDPSGSGSGSGGIDGDSGGDYNNQNKKKSNELSDEELIKQLTQAADDVESNYFPTKQQQSTSSSSSSSLSAPTTTTTSTTTAIEGTQKEDDENVTTQQGTNETAVDSNFDDIMNEVFSSKSSKSSKQSSQSTQSQQPTAAAPIPPPLPPPSTTTISSPPITSAGAELQALEDLEKELGLDLGSSMKTTTNAETTTTSTSTTATTMKDDGLDDLEDFLESLNK